MLLAFDVRHLPDVALYRHAKGAAHIADLHALFVPEGFAVGTMTLLPKTLLLTRFSAPVVPAARSGLLWNDPALGITWPLMGAVPVMEAADRALPRLAEIDDPFPD